MIKNITVGIPHYMLTVTASSQMYRTVYILTYDHLRIHIRSAVTHLQKKEYDILVEQNID
jgi:mRNA-degrading endonuclease HigB of HigAB toxin-antitoxin module